MGKSNKKFRDGQYSHKKGDLYRLEIPFFVYYQYIIAVC